MRMKIVITCGPGSEPIDAVRRITNFSTGELGILLANRLARAGCGVTLFRGTGATCAIPVEGATVVPFTTNDDLRAALEALPHRDDVAAIFHAAALCDFKITRVLDADGGELKASKIPSSLPRLQLVLEPSPKLIAELRALFPKSRIVGWKYELAGGRDEAVGKAVQQIHANQTDACVVNGAAYGAGFGFCGEAGLIAHLAGKPALCDFLANEFAAGK